MGSPGISISAVIQQMGKKQICDLIGYGAVATLAKLGGADPGEDTLIRVAKSYYENDSAGAIQNTETRHLLIDALPRDKANELCRKLGIPIQGNVYSRIKQDENKHSYLKALYEFFGVVQSSSASLDLHDSVTEIRSSYALFDHQRIVVARVLSALRDHPHKTLLHMPTGSGKTRTAMHVIARHLIEKGTTLVCWLAGSGELLEQASDEIERSWRMLGDRPINIYRFWGNRTLDLSSVRSGVLVAGFQKMHAAYRQEQNTLISLGDFASLTIVDEAHQAIAPTYRSVVDALYTKRPTNSLLGLSATPGRSWTEIERDRELSDFFGGQKVTVSNPGHSNPVNFLIDEGFLARPYFKTLVFDGDLDVSNKEMESLQRTGDLPDEIIEALSTNSDRNHKIITEVEELSKLHRRIIVFANSVYHGIFHSLDAAAACRTAAPPVF